MIAVNASTPYMPRLEIVNVPPRMSSGTTWRARTAVAKRANSRARSSSVCVRHIAQHRHEQVALVVDRDADVDPGMQAHRFAFDAGVEQRVQRPARGRRDKRCATVMLARARSGVRCRPLRLLQRAACSARHFDLRGEEEMRRASCALGNARCATMRRTGLNGTRRSLLARRSLRRTGVGGDVLSTMRPAWPDPATSARFTSSMRPRGRASGVARIESDGATLALHGRHRLRRAWLRDRRTAVAAVASSRPGALRCAADDAPASAVDVDPARRRCRRQRARR